MLVLKRLMTKQSSMDESGDVITKDALGNTIAIKPAAVKAEKSTPVMVNGVPKTVKNVPGTNDVKILNTDGTLSAGGSMPIPKTTEEPTPLIYRSGN